MAVVNVGGMRMIVLLRLVAMPVRMCSGDVSLGVGVSMMLVMPMDVEMLERFVAMIMTVQLAEQPPYGESRQRRRRGEPPGSRLTEHEHARHCAGERCGGEVGRGASGAEPAERNHVEHETQSVRGGAHSPPPPRRFPAVEGERAGVRRPGSRIRRRDP